MDAMQRAGKLYKDGKRLKQVRLRGMAMDFSWKNSAASYAVLYEAVRGQVS